MGSNILSIGQSALNAAQIGLSTTGHNIANAATPGYNRQVVVQSSGGAQSFGFGFVGQGVQVASIQRVYSDFLNNQMVSSQSAKSALDTYHTQISGIDNVLADSGAGLSPALQSFFTAVQDLTANPNSAASRQATLSGGQTLAARFQSLNSQLADSRENVNTQITSSVTAINTYAQQIAQLNQAIGKATGSGNGSPPNDLLDQRDQVIADLNKQVKATVVKQDDGGYSVFIGNGQPLVLGAKTFALTTGTAVDDPGRLQVAYVNNGNTILLAENTLTGGTLGGLFDYRSQTLDVAQNALGRVAIGLATDFNTQHMAGLDQNGDPGKAFFTVGVPAVTANRNNAVDPVLGGAMIQASISNTAALTTSNYSVQFTGGQYIVTRLSDGAVNPQPATPATSLPQTMDGVVFTVDPSKPVPTDGDRFLVKPTVNGAQNFAVNTTNITDTTKIAAAGVSASPVLSSIGSNNTGSGTVQVSGVDAGYAAAPLPAGQTLAFQYDLASNSFTVTPPGAVTIGGTTYPAGTAVPYTAGAAVNSRGINFTISGTPLADGDSFNLRPSNNVGDNSNALALAALQTKNTLVGAATNYQGAYSQLVSLIGNKTHELDVSSTAEGNLLAAVQQTQQSESGVNLDEEAANIMRYQQAYQAAAKLMQTASTMFDTLLNLGQ